MVDNNYAGLIPLEVLNEVVDRPKALEYLKRLAELAYMDPVTGAYSHVALTHHLNRSVREVNGALYPEGRRGYEVHDGPLGIVIVDAGGLKAINEGYGRSEGDAALRELADASRQYAHRPSDLVARWGNAADELAIVLPHTDEEGCIAVTQRILDRLGNYSRLPDGLKSSAGIRVYNPRDEVIITDPNILLHQADEATAAAKEHRKLMDAVSIIAIYRLGSGIWLYDNDNREKTFVPYKPLS